MQSSVVHEVVLVGEHIQHVIDGVEVPKEVDDVVLAKVFLMDTLKVTFQRI
jgi:hypothetical protein